MEIKEIKEPQRFPSFKEACSSFSMDEIFLLAEAGYLMQIDKCGGVIDE